MQYQIKITLQDIRPPIWRRLLVPAGISLFDLHLVIQAAMGWDGYHLHDFTIKGQRYAVPHPDDFDTPIDERKARLEDVAMLGSKLIYQYDFGDSWYHEVVVEKVVADALPSGPVCLKGARACPPEDSGGPGGYADKLRVLSGSKDKEYRELREWIGPSFDPEKFDIVSVNQRLQRLAPKAPRSGKKRASKRGQGSSVERSSDIAGLPMQGLEGYDQVIGRFLELLPPEKRMEGLAPQQRMAGLAPQQRMAGLAPQQRMEGLAPEQVMQTLGLDQLLLVMPDELLRALSDDFIAKLPEPTRSSIRKRLGR